MHYDSSTVFDEWWSTGSWGAAYGMSCSTATEADENKNPPVWQIQILVSISLSFSHFTDTDAWSKQYTHKTQVHCIVFLSGEVRSRVIEDVRIPTPHCLAAVTSVRPHFVRQVAVNERSGHRHVSYSISSTSLRSVKWWWRFVRQLCCWYDIDM